MSDERDDLLKEIGDALRIQPSPSFAAGVRTRIASADAPRGWTAWLAWAGAGSLVAASVAVLAISRTADVEVPVPVGTPVVASAEPPVVSRPIEVVPALASVLSTATVRRHLPAPERGRHVEVLVPADERRGLDLLLRRLRNGTAYVPSVESGVDPVTGELLPLPKVEIPPIVPDEGGSIRNRAGRPR